MRDTVREGEMPAVTRATADPDSQMPAVTRATADPNSLAPREGGEGRGEGVGPPGSSPNRTSVGQSAA